MSVRRTGMLVAAGLVMCMVAPTFSAAQRPATGTGQWVVPRTPDGHPDLQGNWTNATITPIQRPGGVGPVLTAEQVAGIEGTRQDYIDNAAAASDPDRGAPPVGGNFTGDVLFDAASGGTGGYNYFYIDGGDRVAVFNGEARSSIVTNPSTGRIPAMTPEARERIAEAMRANRRFGEYDNPENRPLAERCLKSFGSNAGPPMLPNYFYNNNYTIVQTADHVMIMTEMVHDTRIIRLGAREPLPEHIRPWFGDSRGWWEGDTLVVETTHLPAKQVGASSYVYPGGSEQMKVLERFTRADETTMNYQFTVIDPGMYSSAWGGEVPFTRQTGLVYEYACHEGNYAMENVLRGARSQEREGGS